MQLFNICFHLSSPKNGSTLLNVKMLQLIEVQNYSQHTLHGLCMKYYHILINSAMLMAKWPKSMNDFDKHQQVLSRIHFSITFAQFIIEI
jgi:hypothetical protein